MPQKKLLCTIYLNVKKSKNRNIRYFFFLYFYVYIVTYIQDKKRKCLTCFVIQKKNTKETLSVHVTIILIYFIFIGSYYNY